MAAEALEMARKCNITNSLMLQKILTLVTHMVRSLRSFLAQAIADYASNHIEKL